MRGVLPVLLACCLVGALDARTLDVRTLGARGDGETDDSAAIQRALDQSERPLTVRIPAGTYRIARTLRVGGGTEILAEPDARLFLCERTPHRAGDFLLTNARQDGEPDRGITVCGGIWDGNCRRGTNVKPANLLEPGGWSGATLNFRNVRGLVLRRMELANSVTFNVRMCKVDGFRIEDIRISSREFGWNQDGIHMNGFCFNGLIENVRVVSKGQTNDDLLAFNADDSMERVDNQGMCRGPITNVVCRGIFAEDCYTAIRFLSVDSPIRDVHVEDITTGCRFYAVNADAARYCLTPLFDEKDRPHGVGCLENVTVSNFTFWATSEKTRTSMPLVCLETNAEDLRLEGLTRDAARDVAPQRPFLSVRKTADLCLSFDCRAKVVTGGLETVLKDTPSELRVWRSQKRCARHACKAVDRKCQESHHQGNHTKGEK